MSQRSPVFIPGLPYPRGLAPEWYRQVGRPNGMIWEVSANIVEKILKLFHVLLSSVLLAQVRLDAVTRGIGALAGSRV